MIQPRNHYMLRNCTRMLLDDLQYPVAKDGAIIDGLGGYGLAPGIAWHLNRARLAQTQQHRRLPLIEAYDDPLIKKAEGVRVRHL